MENTTAALRGATAHHVARVLRARVGDAVRVTDGAGRAWPARIATISDEYIGVQLETALPTTRPPCAITVGIALLPHDRWRLAIEHAVVLGAASIQPLHTARTTIPTSTDKLAKWQAFADLSAEQSDRLWWPRVLVPCTWRACCATLSNYDHVVLCAETQRGRGCVPLPNTARTTLVLIGPEGGWTADELATAQAAGAHVAGLGPLTLRTETAVAVALTLLQHPQWTVAAP